jgi:hypothetical protein
MRLLTGFTRRREFTFVYCVCLHWDGVLGGRGWLKLDFNEGKVGMKDEYHVPYTPRVCSILVIGNHVSVA